MEKLDLNCLGIVIKFNPDQKAAATITSSMKEENSEENKDFNFAVDCIESMILAHFCAGMDVTTSQYIEGIEVAYEAINNHIEHLHQPTPTPDGYTRVVVAQDVSATGWELTEYEVKKADWDEAVEDYRDTEIALDELRRANKAKRTNYENEITPSETFNVEVSEK